MTQELTRIRSPLLPDRRPAPDFFVCDILDAAPKGDMASMEHPIFSLSIKPNHRTRRYEHGDVFIEIAPSAQGLATVHDRDILIYCISHLMASLNDEQAIACPLLVLCLLFGRCFLRRFVLLFGRLADDTTVERDAVELQREATIFVAPCGTDSRPIALAVAGFTNVPCMK